MRDQDQFYTSEQNNLPLIFSIWGLSSFNSEPLNVTGILSMFKFCIKNSSTAAFIEVLANLLLGERVVIDDNFQKSQGKENLLLLDNLHFHVQDGLVPILPHGSKFLQKVFQLDLTCCWICGRPNLNVFLLLF